MIEKIKYAGSIILAIIKRVMRIVLLVILALIFYVAVSLLGLIFQWLWDVVLVYIAMLMVIIACIKVGIRGYL